MAIIYSYPRIDEVQGSDLILLADASKQNKTKSASVGQLLQGQATIIQIDDRVVTGASFDTGDGVLTLTRNSGDISSVTTNLDGRYALTSSLAGTDRYIPRFDGTSSLVNSVIYEDTDGHVGVGVVGTPPNPVHKFEVFDLRDENPSSDYSSVVTTHVNEPWTGGAGGILSRLSTDSGAKYAGQISLVPGTKSNDVLSNIRLSFHANSDMDTSSPSNLSGTVTHDGTNAHWILNGTLEETTTATLKVNGTGEFTGQITIPETPVAGTDAASKAYVNANSGGGGAVDSVNGQTGTVVLTTSDITNDSGYVTGTASADPSTTAVTEIKTLTSAEYALETKLDNVMYVII